MGLDEQKDLFSNTAEDYDMAVKCLGEAWGKYLYEEFGKKYMKDLSAFIRKERKEHTIRPAAKNTFRAFQLTNPETIKTVMIGMDPYPHKAADGVAFSSRTGAIPPSLARIYNEIEKDIYQGKKTKRKADLSHWAEQGVLLINRSLTVRQGEPKSHHTVGWERFLEEVLILLNRGGSKAFISFGKDAQYLLHDDFVFPDRHLVIKASHPARANSYAMNLKDRGYFRQIDDFVREQYEEPIIW